MSVPFFPPTEYLTFLTDADYCFPSLNSRMNLLITLFDLLAIAVHRIAALYSQNQHSRIIRAFQKDNQP